MARIPDILDLLLSGGNNAAYARNKEALNAMRQFPEAGTRTSVPGRYGSLQRSLEDELFWIGTPTGVSYGAPSPGLARQQAREATARIKAMNPLIEKYTELRKQGLSHNDTLDIIHRAVVESKDPNLRRMEAVLRRHYQGNRSGPMSDSGEEILPQDLLR